MSFGFVAEVCFLAWYSWQLCVCFLLAVALHEAAHLIVLRFNHIPMYRLRLGMAGAQIETGPMSLRQELWCALAGPTVSILSGAVLLRPWPLFALVSFGLAAVNLLPVYPLDGGRALRAVLYSHLDETKARKILRGALWVTLTTLMLLACWLTVSCQAGLWPIFVALVLLCRAGNAADGL